MRYLRPEQTSYIMKQTDIRILEELQKWAEDYTRENNSYVGLCRTIIRQTENVLTAKALMDAAERVFQERQRTHILRVLDLISSINHDRQW